MKRLALVYSAVMLGVVAFASSFAEPSVSARSSTGPSATIAVTCRSTGVLFVNYTYSGLSGAVRGVDFHVDKVGETVDAVTGRSGQVVQAFNQSAQGHAVNWGTVGAKSVGHTGKLIAGSSTVWNNGAPVTC